MDALAETGQLPSADRPSLFLGARPHPAVDPSHVTCWQPFKPWAEECVRAGHVVMEAIPGGKWPLVLYVPGKSREEILAGFASAIDRLAPGGTLAVAMTNDTGAARFERELARATGGVSSFSKRKCRAFSTCPDGTADHNTIDTWRRLGAATPVESTDFLTVPGVFSAGRIDAGSALLASHLPADLRGLVADPGAGWGFLSHHVLTSCPGVDRIDLYEADARALACARLNLAHAADRAAFHWHDVSTCIPGTYDAVVMNPPFHTGRAQDIGLGKSFLRAAAESLRRGGRLFLVANRQLPYERELGSLGIRWRILDEDATFKIISASKP